MNGGWWHDSRILAATGEGILKEEPRAWSGWWNEKIVELINLTIEQPDAVCILLTGRSESGFSELIKRMIKSKGLEFDLVSLKPAVGPSGQRFTSTMNFKQVFLTSVMETYKQAEEIRIYEDRPKHTKGFRDFLADYNKRLQNGPAAQRTRGPITAEVVQVAELCTNLDPVMEIAEIQQLINDHNATLPKRRPGVRDGRLAIKKSVFYTGYLINPADTQRLLSLVQIPQNIPEADLKYHANNIMICPRPCPGSILDKVGGMGSKMTWVVTGTACFENNIWAACVKPVPSTAKFHTEHASPLVVLALRKGARPVDAGKIQNWQPVPRDKAFVFETVVGEKVLLRIEAEEAGGDFYGSVASSKGAPKRKHTSGGEDDFRRTGHNHPTGPKNFGGRGGGGGPRGGGGFRGGNANRGFRGGRGGGGGGRGRGGKGGGHHYKSLDDIGTRENQGGFAQQVSYEDSGFQGQPPLGPASQYYNHQHGTFPQQQQQQQQGFGNNWQQGGGGRGNGNNGGGGGGNNGGGGGNNGGGGSGYGDMNNYY